MSLTAAHLKTVHELAARIKRPLKFMEVCGTHTLSACRSGLRWLLPENISFGDHHQAAAGQLKAAPHVSGGNYYIAAPDMPFQKVSKKGVNPVIF